MIWWILVHTWLLLWILSKFKNDELGPSVFLYLNIKVSSFSSGLEHQLQTCSHLVICFCQLLVVSIKYSFHLNLCGDIWIWVRGSKEFFYRNFSNVFYIYFELLYIVAYIICYVISKYKDSMFEYDQI